MIAYDMTNHNWLEIMSLRLEITVNFRKLDFTLNLKKVRFYGKFFKVRNYGKKVRNSVLQNI